MNIKRAPIQIIIISIIAISISPFICFNTFAGQSEDNIYGPKPSSETKQENETESTQEESPIVNESLLVKKIYRL